MEPIKDIVRQFMRDLTTQKSGADEPLPSEWLKKVLTKRELAHIKFNYFKKGVLSVWVDSSSWLYSLNLRKADLLKQLGGLSRDIQDIRFRIGDTK